MKDKHALHPRSIRLTTLKQLKVYMDPVRQQILRTMEILAEPVTAKKLADKMGVTPSSAKHHLTQLERIGLVCVDHTEQIHGITAVFYRVLPVEVSIGMNLEAHAEERSVIAENQIASVFSRFSSKAKAYPQTAENEPFAGDMHTGVLHLTQREADELYRTVRAYIRGHETPREGTIPFEFAMILYNAKDEV